MVFVGFFSPRQPVQSLGIQETSLVSKKLGGSWLPGENFGGFWTCCVLGFVFSLIRVKVLADPLYTLQLWLKYTY